MHCDRGNVVPLYSAVITCLLPASSHVTAEGVYDVHQVEAQSLPITHVWTVALCVCSLIACKRVRDRFQVVVSCQLGLERHTSCHLHGNLHECCSQQLDCMSCGCQRLSLQLVHFTTACL